MIANLSLRANANNEFIDPTKRTLLLQIESTPGIRHRELLRTTKFSNGVMTYHISALEKLNMINVDRKKNNKNNRYYIVNIQKEEAKIIGYVRNSVNRNIIKYILDNELCTFSEIRDHIKKAPSTISWHLKRLNIAGVILIIQGVDSNLYRISDSERVAKILHKYKDSFMDRVVDNYTELITEL